MSAKAAAILKDENEPPRSEEVPEIRSGEGPQGDDDDEPIVQLTRTRFVLVILALFLAILLSSLDQTILATAVSVLSTEFQSADLIPWIGIAYLLTSAGFSSVYGKLADIFGRKVVFVCTILMFEIGSLICGLANSMTMLIAGRAIAGIGGGGIMSLVLIIISDIVTFRDRGKYQGLLGAAFGLASVIGPLIGGAFTDSSATWRWCFYINLPLGGFVILVIIFLLKFPETTDSKTFALRLKSIDYLGVVLILTTVTCFLLPLQLGGSRWNWADPQTIALLVVSVVLFGVTFYVEGWVAKDPIIPGSVFVNSTVYAGLLFSFFMGIGFVASIYYVPIYFQVVQGESATNSGIKTLPMMAGLIVTSIGAGFSISRGVSARTFVVAGGILITVGCGLTTLLDENMEYWKAALIILTYGIAVGCMVQSRTLIVQAAVPKKLIAVATGLVTFCQMLGGTVGLTIFGTVFNNQIYAELLAALPKDIATPELVRTLTTEPLAVREAAKTIPNGEQILLPIYLHCFSAALRIGFFAILPVGVLILVCSAFMNHIPSTKAKEKDTESAESTSVEDN
ncbi:major facilitator superfamily domain-containing protein [Cladochytrium replicatum]|nr:major facilitator superfamily domain-containing protein [Cladochytrium replicatum]